MVFSQAIITHRTPDEPLSADLDLFWGSLPKCMFTLFKAITGGLSWHDCVHPLSELPPVWIGLFLIYISLTTLAVLNVITGVFCHSAIEGSQNDRDFVTQKHLAMKQEYIKTIRDVFQDIDTDNSNQITLQEFEDHFDDAEARAFFDALEIETDMAYDVFELLDMDGGGYLDIDEFVMGCLKLRGNARSLEVTRLQIQTRRVERSVCQLRDLLQSFQQEQTRRSPTLDRLSHSGVDADSFSRQDSPHEPELVRGQSDSVEASATKPRHSLQL
jgi:Ca2+-binding EF-hand superfamily protein